MFFKNLKVSGKKSNIFIAGQTQYLAGYLLYSTVDKVPGRLPVVLYCRQSTWQVTCCTLL